MTMGPTSSLGFLPAIGVEMMSLMRFGTSSADRFDEMPEKIMAEKANSVTMSFREIDLMAIGCEYFGFMVFLNGLFL